MGSGFSTLKLPQNMELTVKPESSQMQNVGDKQGKTQNHQPPSSRTERSRDTKIFEEFI